MQKVSNPSVHKPFLIQIFIGRMALDCSVYSDWSSPSGWQINPFVSAFFGKLQCIEFSFKCLFVDDDMVSATHRPKTCLPALKDDCSVAHFECNLSILLIDTQPLYHIRNSMSMPNQQKWDAFSAPH